MTTKAKRLHAAWRETAPRFLIEEGAIVRCDDRPCIVTEVRQDRDGKYLFVLPVGNTQHLIVREAHWGLLTPDTAD